MYLKLIPKHELLTTFTEEHQQALINYLSESILRMPEFLINKDNSGIDLSKLIRKQHKTDKKTIERWFSNIFQAISVGDGNCPIDLVVNEVGVDIKSMAFNGGILSNESSLSQNFIDDTNGKEPLDSYFKELNSSKNELIELYKNEKFEDLYNHHIFKKINNLLYEKLKNIYNKKFSVFLNGELAKTHNIKSIRYYFFMQQPEGLDYSIYGFEIFPASNNGSFSFEEYLKEINYDMVFFDVIDYLKNDADKKSLFYKTPFIDADNLLTDKFGAISLYQSKKRIEIRLNKSELNKKDMYGLDFKLNKNVFKIFKDVFIVHHNQITQVDYTKKKMELILKSLIELDKTGKGIYYVDWSNSFSLSLLTFFLPATICSNLAFMI